MSGKISRQLKFITPTIVGTMVGAILAAATIAYSYNYAWRHDSSIINFQHYLVDKPYRVLQFFVSLLPVAVGYFFGRARERLTALRQLYYEALVREKEQEEKTHIELSSFSAETLRQLTRRELEILELVCRGLGNKDIAVLLFISEKTVKNHITSIFRKLEVSNRTNAALVALQARSGGKTGT